MLPMTVIRAGIINVTGYIGTELARLLYQHPRVELKSVTGRSAAGQKLGEIFPHLADVDLLITDELEDNIDVAFSAMPHKNSVAVVQSLLRRGIKVIDVSADFRLKDINKYSEWYQFNHPASEMLKEAVYGLPELHREEIVSAHLVANPGCYSTCAILALAPVIKEGLIHPDIIIDSKSGVSGAGRTLSIATHYAEVNENIYAYAVEGHRHLPEIEQELRNLKPENNLSITFVPHIVPMTRGILSSCYARLRDTKPGDSVKDKEELYLLYQEFYQDSPFVKVMNRPPQTKHAWGNNFCLIYPTLDSRTGRLIVLSCLDNLVKGGAGQAIQNMNLMFDLPETSGLENMAIYP